MTMFALSRLRVDCTDASAGNQAHPVAAEFLPERSATVFENLRLMLAVQSGHASEVRAVLTCDSAQTLA
jgi:hypothetical protein